MKKNNYCSLSWINEAPNEWKSTRLGYISQCNGRIGFRGYTEEDLVGEGEGPITLSPSNIIDNKLDLTNCSYISWDKYYESPEIQIHNKDILLVKTASVGKCTIYNSNEIATLNPQIVVLKNIKINYKYLYYYLTSDCIQIPIQLDCVGGVIKTITQKNIFDYKILLPNAKEQKLIADFLDDRIEKIDVMLNRLNNQIEILKKYKKSLITETVIKGIDSNVEVKDSGIEWLGRIPKLWQICRIKDVCSLARGGSPRPIDDYLSYNDEDINWIKIGDTRKGYKYIDSTEQKIIKAGISKSRYVQKGDLILTNSMSFGQPYILNINGCIHDGWLVFSNYKEIDKLFLYYVLMSDICFYQFKKSVAGAVVENLNIDKVASSKILVPPLYIQEKIISYLEDKCNKIDELFEDKQKQIEKMEQYKKSLIYEYVTGKKRVKGAEELYG